MGDIMTAHRQVAALPLRRSKEGALEILLVTSRTTGRWIIPKGWPSKRIKDHKAAAREARQEGGVKGKIKPKAIGSYRYVKTELGEGAPVDVAVYLLSVRKESKRWPEKRERRRAWFDVLDAARRITEPELQLLIEALQKLGKSLPKAKRPIVCA
jgi:8-oxo-dGTP pyrophosphatase MutT (NUDIX family)